MISYDSCIRSDERKYIRLTSAEQEEVKLLKELYEEGAKILICYEESEGKAIQFDAYTEDIYNMPQYPVAVITGSTAKFVYDFCYSEINKGRTKIKLEQVIHKLNQHCVSSIKGKRGKES